MIQRRQASFMGKRPDPFDPFLDRVDFVPGSLATTRSEGTTRNRRLTREPNNIEVTLLTHPLGQAQVVEMRPGHEAGL